MLMPFWCEVCGSLILLPPSTIGPFACEPCRVLAVLFIRDIAVDLHAKKPQAFSVHPHKVIGEFLSLLTNKEYDQNGESRE